MDTSDQSPGGRAPHFTNGERCVDDRAIAQPDCPPYAALERVPGHGFACANSRYAAPPVWSKHA